MAATGLLRVKRRRCGNDLLLDDPEHQRRDTTDLIELRNDCCFDDLVDHGYRLGLERYATDAIVVVGHMGTGNAQSAFVGDDPTHGTAVAVMTNTSTPGPQDSWPSRRSPPPVKPASRPRARSSRTSPRASLTHWICV